MNSFFKLYNKDKTVILAELYEFSGLNYTKTLNGTCSLEVNFPTKYLANNFIEIIPGQCIELYEIINNEEKIIWWGNINNPCPNGVDLQVTCLGYYNLFADRKFTDLPWNEEEEDWKITYYSKKYGQLIVILINRINNISQTGITIGEIKEGSLVTDRIINWDDDLKEKIDEFIEDSSYYFTIDKDKKFNFYSDIGKIKDYYEINDYNIVDGIDITIDCTQIYNRVIGRVIYKEDDIVQIIKTVVEDKKSIAKYGLKEYCYKNDQLRTLSTLTEQCQDFLDTYKEPLESIQLEVAIKDNFNIYDIDPGDYIYFNSENYNYNSLIRVLEYTVDALKNTAKITLGNAIFREKPISIYRYK